MAQSVWTVAVTILTALCLAALLWAQQRHREERRRRKQGLVTVPVGAGHMVTGGCLGLLAYSGLLFVAVSLTLDLLDQAAGPDWLAWVVAIGLLVGFFLMVGWAAVGIGDSFATTRLSVDKEGIRLIRRGRPRTVIFWDKRWRLEQLARLRPVGTPALGGTTEYSLLMRLNQGHKELLLAFDVSGREVGGLDPYDGRKEGLHITDMAEWLRAEILFRHERWQDGPDRLERDAAANFEQWSPLASAAALEEALHFGEEELAQNRAGLVSASQSGVIRRDQKLTLATYLVLAAVFGAGGLYCLLRVLRGGSFQSFGPWLIVLLLTAGFCSLMAIISREQLRSEILVERVGGRIQLQHYRRSDEYWLRVNDEAFAITSKLDEALQDEAYYHLYVARYGLGGLDAKLLSAEELQPGPGTE